ncbi:cobalamin-dependent protein [Micromonospora sp. NPDC049081]|uniref:cobalamin B12-binding domain-containing protein n=1 Tax=Micromonospora sp. NPDC049081 TaxID=3155150 RepID=UPI0033FC0ACF
MTRPTPDEPTREEPGRATGEEPAGTRRLPPEDPGRVTPDGPGRVAPGVVQAYLGCLDRADLVGATRLATGLLDAGASVADVLVDLVAVAQREVGLRWLSGRWSIAQEHAATHVSEQVVEVVAAHTAPTDDRGHVVLACVEGEWHALAARIVMEVVRAAGWRVTFLGASVPVRQLVSYLHQTGPDAVLLSCVQPSRLVRAGRMVEACRAAGVPVVAGGPGFGPEGRWATTVGAAGWGATARDAVRLLSGPLLAAPHTGAAPTAGSDEYVPVLRRRRELVQLVLREVTPVAERAEEVAGVVAQLVDALAAAIRIGDPQLLVEFVRWQAGVLDTRDGARLLDDVLRVCATALTEHPRSADHLHRARTALATPP